MLLERAPHYEWVDEGSSASVGSKIPCLFARIVEMAWIMLLQLYHWIVWVISLASLLKFKVLDARALHGMMNNIEKNESLAGLVLRGVSMCTNMYKVPA